ncbi:MAG: DNA ligase D [Anaerolineales bacterium]|nr:MAG: DNA ligase D [Anaerolineales bacterium]
MVDPQQSLQEYRNKRDFSKTSEPRPSDAASGAVSLGPHQARFCIQKHDATRLHYDVRLEIEGVLVSWAVPQGPSYDPVVKRLAVRTEDHPMEYLDFEGVIPKGEYGAGPIILWDQGVYTNIRGTKRKPFSMKESLDAGLVEVRLEGEKVKGEFALVRTKYEGKQENWLMVKMKDSFANPEYDIVADLPLSVKSGKSIEELEEEGSRAQLPAALRSLQPETLDKLVPDSFPGWKEPMLASPEDRPTERANWIYEPKLDGQRAIIYRKGGQVQMLSRNKLIITEQYPELAAALKQHGRGDFVADAEIVSFEGQRASFEQMQKRMHVQRPSKELIEDAPVFMYLFDVTYYEGYDTTRLSQLERKQLLRGLVEYNDPLRYMEYQEGGGLELFQQACASGQEGVIAKDSNAPYQRSRSKSWLKWKCVRQQEFVVGGFTLPAGGMRGFGALLVGYYSEGGDKLQFVGGVGTGYSDEAIRDIRRKLDSLATNDNPFMPDDLLPLQDVQWVRPELVVQVGFGEWTKLTKIRHPRYLGLRTDKDARSVRREATTAEPAQPAAQPVPAEEPRAAGDETREVEGQKIKITNPGKMLFPDVNKARVIDYYEQIAPVMLPHVANRPISMQRFPDGIRAQGFFHKEAPEYFPKFVSLVEVRTSASAAETQLQVMINNAATLVYLAQLASFVIHIWTSQAPLLDQPDKIVFDLDPSTDDSWDAVVSGARDMRRMLTEMGLPSFVMATGSRGLHVCVPLVPQHNFDTVLLFAKAVCTTLERRDPKFTTQIRKDKRKGRIFLDYLRNRYAQTGIAPYSLRAKPGAPLAAPLAWEELEDPSFRADKFNVSNIMQRLSNDGDPWAGFFAARTALPDFGLIEQVLKA